MEIKIEFSIRHMWVGIFWETWPEPFRRDIWINLIPFVSIHIIDKG